MTLDWPALNTKVWLRLPCCGDEHPTRIEDHAEGGECVVAAPVAPHTEPVRPPTANRQGFFVGWTMEKGALEAPVELSDQKTGELPTWTLRPIGSLVETQRRNFVRLETNVHVRLHIMESGAPIEAITLDVSEGGLRCRIDKWALDPGGRPFAIELPFADELLHLTAQSVWWGPLGSDGYRAVGLRFLDVPPSVADTIRVYIFNAQIELRRRRLDG